MLVCVKPKVRCKNKLIQKILNRIFGLKAMCEGEKRKDDNKYNKNY